MYFFIIIFFEGAQRIINYKYVYYLYVVIMQVSPGYLCNVLQQCQKTTWFLDRSFNGILLFFDIIDSPLFNYTNKYTA